MLEERDAIALLQKKCGTSDRLQRYGAIFPKRQAEQNPQAPAGVGGAVAMRRIKLLHTLLVDGHAEAIVVIGGCGWAVATE